MQKILIGLLAYGVMTSAVLAADAHLLGSELTLNGANPNASSDGVIPAYTGGITQLPAGYVPGGDHIDPFGDDTPLFSITPENAASYQNRLSAGQLALLARHPASYRMDVYPTRRSCALPQFVYDETRKNVARAKLTNEGNGVEGARIGVPFPIPKQAVEIFWNHNFHWYGHRYQAVTSGANVYPNGSRTRIVRQDWRYNFYADPQGHPETRKNDQYNWMGVWTTPPRFNGSGFSMTNTIDQVKEPRKGFFFRPDLRKIIRTTPAAATYDGPLSTADGLRNSDNMFLMSGAPDRYDWEIIGKQEIYVPYNAYKASSTETRAAALMTPNHPNPDYLRYELHRVWVLRATGKPDHNPKFTKRVFYADEDSWIFLMADLYEGDGELTHTQHAFIKNYYEAPACIMEFDVMHHLESGRYNIDHIKLEKGPANLDADVEPKDFGASALRRRIGR